MRGDGAGWSGEIISTIISVVILKYLGILNINNMSVGIYIAQHQHKTMIR
jgi:hypothetical protein